MVLYCTLTQSSKAHKFDKNLLFVSIYTEPTSILKTGEKLMVTLLDKVIRIQEVSADAIKKWHGICNRHSIGSQKVSDELKPVVKKALEEIKEILESKVIEY